MNEIRIPGENYRPVVRQWYIYHTMLYWVHFAMSRIWIHNYSADMQGLHKQLLIQLPYDYNYDGPYARLCVVCELRGELR